ncbi:hypothetical protein AQUCO_00901063v1 [Aquilegia coerulea]|uniref:Glycosyl transferase family 1 domain-containing protein n=2 Tax=Aquilegia coerulea TaxID=218851 RepID=A0A2G5EGJ6_AQUCA|nr:hypothetical protein AQUCO_00901063v1 [Aquilegia coerulea]
MGRNSPSSDRLSTSSDANVGLGFKKIRDRFLFKRNSHAENHREDGDERDRKFDRHGRNRSHHNRIGRKSFSFKGIHLFYLVIAFAFFAFVVASVLLQSSITSVFRLGSERGKSFRDGLKFGGSLRFFPDKLMSTFAKHRGQDRSTMQAKVGLRPPRLAIILGNMKKDPSALMLFTVLKSLQRLGYRLKIYAVEDGNARTLWEQIGGRLSILSLNRTEHVDWSIYEGVIANSLEAKEGFSSLLQEPFCSIPLIWIIQEDTLAKRLPLYMEMGWEHLIDEWRIAFTRADVIAYLDFSLPMLYSVLDTGNFFVIPGSPVDVWGAERYIKSHSINQLKNNFGFHKNDLVVMIVGSSFFYDKLSWDYAVSMHVIGPLLMKVAKKEADLSFKFVFLCGNSTDGYNDALQEVASRLGLPDGSLVHYGLDGDVNSALFMSDIVLHGSFQDEQGFPSLLIRAMSFGIPVVAPDLPIIKKYVVDGVHGLIYRKQQPETLMRAFSLLVAEGKLSKFAHLVGSSGKLLAKNMLASECVYGFAQLLENILHFPSDAIHPGQSQLQQHTWQWNSFRKEVEQTDTEISEYDQNNIFTRKSSVVYSLEDALATLDSMKDTSKNETNDLTEEIPSKLDWEILREMENSEEFERRETEELEERMEKTLGSWEDIYRNARKVEKLKFEANERDEGELERIGQQLCIYEIYTGAGAWSFLRHGSLYRGLSLSSRARRPRSDDVDAVFRLPLLNDTYYRDLLCELGGMFSIANRVDNIHNVPWIGFQSWRASGRKVSLSVRAEMVLEETIQEDTEGDTIYYWAKLDLDNGDADETLTFWSLCDIMNGGHCRTAFADAFRQLYGLPPSVEALPPMPEDGGYWAALHSWVMPTPSFLEFMMFSRMFVDSLDSLNSESNTTCLLGSSKLEERHCYCRMLELLVNVWAYHSARRLVFVDPNSGLVEEQHLIEQRKGFMWVKFFNFTLLKSMDEDLAEAADDDDHPREGWLWPYTGEVHWRGIYEREREERYRLKMDKKRKTKEKLLERQKYGYKQKTLGR